MTLASIQRVIDVFPIDGADRIEGVTVLGWKCVVRKGTFKVGDLCIYIEIDTIIPKQLLDEAYEGDEKIRLRTVKMRKQISQGLVLPILHPYFLSRFRIIDETATEKEKNHFIVNLDKEMLYIENYDDGYSYVEGSDVTTELDIEKYEKPIPLNMSGKIKGNFPGFIPKTDEVKIQSEPKLLNIIAGRPYYITTKIDGTSATYYKFKGEFGVCSRNLELQREDKTFHEGNVYWEIADKYHIEELLREGYAIQGEIYGEGIQKNPLGIKGHDICIFNIYNIHDGLYLPPYVHGWKNLPDLHYVLKDLDIPFVPLEEDGKNFNYTLEQLIEKAKGNYPSGNKKEGIVVRSFDQRVSFKVLNNDFLLEKGE